MKVLIKNIKGEIFPLETESSNSIGALKTQIQTEKGIDAGTIKLILKGKNTEDPQTLQELGVNDGDFLIIMVSKKPQTTTQTQSEMKPEQPTQQETKPQAQTQPISTQNTQSTGNNYSSAASSLLHGDELNKTIDEICGMGFEKSKVIEAMKAAFNNPDRAIDYLFNQKGIPAQTSNPFGQFQPSGGMPPLSGLPSGSQGGNNGGGQAGEDNPLAFLAGNPMFQQLRAAVQTNPQLLQTMLAQLSQTNPQLFQMITQNQEAFLQLLMGGEEGEGYDEGEGPLPPGVISVTPEEKAAIDRLVGLGFDRQLAIEAFLACDRNEEMAANYLLEQQMLGDFSITYKQFLMTGGEGHEGSHQGGGHGPEGGDDYEDDNLFH